MIFAPPPQPQSVEIRYRPSYQEIGDPSVSIRYRTTDEEVIRSREISSYLRGVLAQSQFGRTLDGFSSLEGGWNTFGSEVPAQIAVAAADHAIRCLIGANLIPDAIMPSAEGGVAICFVRGGKYADIECLNTGEILAVKSTQGERPHAWALDATSIDSGAAAQQISAYLSVFV